MASTLKVIQGRPDGKYCQGCSYQPTGGALVKHDGRGTNGIYIVGDSPWKDEVASGRPFAGAAGRWLDTILSKRGLDRGDFYIGNAGTQCAPPALGMNDDPSSYVETQEAMHQCKPYLDEYVAKAMPRVFLALGNVALHRITGYDGIENNHSYVIPSIYEGIPAVPTFHPSYIMQGKWKYTLPFVLALARAIEIANGSYIPTKLTITEDPGPSYLDLPGNSDIPELMMDIETPKSLAGHDEEASEDDPSYQILRAGFSIRPWHGVSFPHDGDYISRAKAIVKRARVLIFWNKNYDLPRLKAAGYDLHPSVTVVDAMWAWHWLYSDLPKALAFAAPFFYNGNPWKHLHTRRPAFYNGCDNAIQMGVFQGVKDQLVRDNRWDRFWSHCVKVDPIYVHMGNMGIKVDKEARIPFMKAMEDDAKVEFAKVQSLVPVNLLEVQESFKPLKVPAMTGTVSDRIRIEFTRVEKTEVATDVPAIGGGFVQRPLYRRYTPFNPNSRDDLLSLMNELKVKPPRARGEDRDSTEAKYLKRITRYPIFKHCISYKQRIKFLSTYNWPLDEWDRVHTTYGYHPSTWRSSSRNVNLGNIPKRYDLARLFRRTVIAERGCRLIEIDRSAIEAVLVGYWAKSNEYINLAKAGVHSWLCSYITGNPVPIDLPFPALKAALKGVKKATPVETYEGMKRVIHGSNYLLSAYGIHDEYEEYFPTEYDAQKAQDSYFNSPAGMAVRRFHKETLDEVQHKKYLLNSFQYKHDFYGPLYKFNKRAKKWEVDPEGDAKRAIAFRPQSDAAAIQREDLLALWAEPDIGPLMRLPTYDSIVLEAPNHMVDRAIGRLVEQFSRGIPELQGLTIGFEIKVGPNLADMEEVVI